jgi:hypothetical protein
METVDQTIKAIASNPYTVIIALIFTVGPVLWQIGKAITGAAKSLKDSFRTSFRSVQFKNQLNYIRSRVHYDGKIGIFKIIEPSNYKIIQSINQFISQIFFIFSQYLYSL